MPASTQQTAEIASITLAANLHDHVYGDLLFRTRAVRPLTDEVAEYPAREYIHSVTLDHGKSVKQTVKEIAGQMAAGIKADFPDGFVCVGYSQPELFEQYGAQSMSRSEVMGINVTVLVHPVGEHRIQLTALVKVSQWRPKSYPFIAPQSTTA